jgi:hypothetical protein
MRAWNMNLGVYILVHNPNKLFDKADPVKENLC